jgi:hypothetical protein
LVLFIFSLPPMVLNFFPPCLSSRRRPQKNIRHRFLDLTAFNFFFNANGLKFFSSRPSSRPANYRRCPRKKYPASLP